MRRVDVTRLAEPLGGLLLLVALAAGQVIDGAVAWRAPVTVVTVVLAPGLAVLGWTELPRTSAFWGFVAATGLAVSGVVAQVLAWTGRLEGPVAMAALAIVTVPLLLAQAVMRARRAPVGAHDR